jgi:uncharacterized protein YyaL (SSP411 family)
LLGNASAWLKELAMGRPVGRQAVAKGVGVTALLTLLLTGASSAGPSDSNKVAKPFATNRLAKESSPYLLQHAHNPVDWYPWGTEAFDRAKREGKLVFLSIGYSSCHWCHVMERESFDNPEVAKLLNDWFVCIKVDREERPDIDSVYMTALNVQGQRGGWPLSMFLTPEGKPIAGGTYWPPEDRQIEGDKIPGLKSVLKTMHDWHSTKPKRLADLADRVAAGTKAALADAARGLAIVDLNRALVDSGLEEVRKEFDKEYGGFGSARGQFRGPKFPVPSYLQLVLRENARARSTGLDAILEVTLDRMARGGIYDQLGGGFHRYSTERTWTVPHFEKMLYDNAQLVEVYAEAYRLTRQPLYRRIVDETLGFVAREMTSPYGAFYSALDADSDGGEGLFYVWTDAELKALLPNEADLALFRKVYGARGEPNFEGKYRILVLPRPIAETAGDLQLTEQQLEARLRPLRQKLFESRSGRLRPFLDTKVLTSWNGQMIAAYATAGRVLANPAYTAAAARAADFVLKNLRNREGRLLRAYGAQPGQSGAARLNGYLDDYAYLTHGVLGLYDGTQDRKWLDEARSLTDTMASYFSDKDAGGFFYTSDDHEKLFARAKDQYDGAQPCGNSMAVRNLVRLAKATGEARYRVLAEKTFKSFAASLKANPTSLTAMLEGLALYLDYGDRNRKDATPTDEPAAQPGGIRKSDAVVKLSAKAKPEKPGDDGKQTVTVTLEIDEGWHVYGNPVGLEDLVSAQTEVTVTSKIKLAEVKVEYPESKELTDAALGKYKVYEREVDIKVNLRRAAGDTGPLEVKVKFQSCNDKQCLLPATKTLKIP